MGLEDNKFSTIRQILGGTIGTRILDITQHDQNEFAETQQCYIELFLDNGQALRFNVNDGFSLNSPDKIKNFECSDKRVDDDCADDPD